MKRPFLLASLACSFLVPALALAAFSRPSDAFTLLGSDGKPREFDSAFFLKFDEGGENLAVFGKVNGMSEGKTRKDIKFQMHADLSVTANEGKGTVGIDLMVHDDTAYIRGGEVDLALSGLSDADIEESLATYNEEFKGKWFSIGLTDVERFESFGGTDFSQLISAGSESITPDDAKELVARVIDAMFAMETSRFKGGNTHLLTLKSHFLRDAAQAAQEWLQENDPSLLQEGALDLNDEDMDAIEQLIGDAVNVRLKIDTNDVGEFRFAKFFAAVTVPDVNVFFSLEGKVEHRPIPVYLDIPKNAEKLEDHMNVFGFPMTATPEGMEDAFPRQFEEDESRDVRNEEPDFPRVYRGGCSSATLEDLSASRKGDCPIDRISRRYLREQTLRNQAERRVSQ